jgi:hypothetical protein
VVEQRCQVTRFEVEGIIANLFSWARIGRDIRDSQTSKIYQPAPAARPADLEKHWCIHLRSATRRLLEQLFK